MNIHQFKRFLRRVFPLFWKADISRTTKTQIKNKTLHAFSQVHNKHRESIFEKWVDIFFTPAFKMGMAAVLMLVAFNLLPFSQTKLLAGHIQPKNGVVKIIRGEETILISENTNLREGDIIQIGHNGEANIIFPDQFQSNLKPRTELKIVNRDEIFIEQGMMINESYENHQFSADRGFVEAPAGSSFIISISETGEMEIIAKRNNINVFDWKNGETTIEAGEKINLRTDTMLTSHDIPSNLNLSTLQINSIQAKLIITRTKLLTTLEKMTSGQRSESEKDFVSAQKSFFSVLDIINSSRDMEIQKRIDWESYDFADVITEMRRKQIPKMMVDEAMALRTLFTIIENNKNNIGFKTQETDMQSFDRFVTIERVFLGSDQEHKEKLKQKYVVVFLRQILNEPLRIDQISVMNEEINKLPKNELAREFLNKLSDSLPPDLADILDEKIERDY